MFAIVDVAVAILILGLVRSGWRRGFAHIVLDVIGFAGAVALTVRFHTVPATVLDWVGLPDGWSGAAGAAAIFVPSIIVVALIGRRIGRFTWLPGVHMVNRLLGVALGAGFGAAVAVAGLLAVQIAPVPALVTDPIRRSTVARTVLAGAAPGLRALEVVATDHTDGYLIHLRWAVAWSAIQAPDAPVVFDPSGRIVAEGGAASDLLYRLNEARSAQGRRRLPADAVLGDTARSRARSAASSGALDATIGRSRASIASLAPTTRLAHDGVMRVRAMRDAAMSATKVGIGAYDTSEGLVVAWEFCVGC